MKKIIITGGLGFIFSHVTEHFISQNYDVYVIDNLSAGSHPELVKPYTNFAKNVTRGRFTFIELDASFATVIPVIKTIDPDYIIHAAAISDVDYSIKQPVKTLQANNNATINVFEAARACRNLKKLLYVSTDEVYGECDHAKEEHEILFPRNPYALSKAFGSILRVAYDNTFKELRDKTVETRFCNVFGPRQDARKILPSIKRALSTGKPVVLHNQGTGYRQFIHVDEIPPIMELLLEKGSRTYNVTTGEGYTVQELCTMAQTIYFNKTVPTVPGTRAGMDMRYEMSAERLRSEFGWKPSMTFMERLTKYFLEHEDIN